MKSPTDLSAPARPYRGMSAEERRLQRREQLMEAALDVFASIGLAKVTMRDICAQARLTERYFYESFRSTEDAFDAVYQRQEEQLFARVAQAMMTAPRNIEALARAGLHAFYAFIKEDPRRAQVLLIDSFSANQQSIDKSKRAVAQYVSMIEQLARELFPGLRPGLNMEMLVWGLLGMAIQVGTIWARDQFRQPIEEVLEYNLYAWQGLQGLAERLGVLER